MENSHFTKNDIAVARRADLALRARFPHLFTRIFEISSGSFLIYFPADQLDASEFADDFAYRMIPATSSICLSNKIPHDFLAEIDIIQDHLIADGLEGLSLSFRDAENLLLSKYPDLPRLFKSGDGNNPIKIYFTEELNDNQKDRVCRFFDEVLPGWPIEINFSDDSNKSKRQIANTNSVADLSIRPYSTRGKLFSFIRDDERFWFDNSQALFQGRYQPNRFLQIDRTATSCYLDASAFPQIDLRQAMLFYDVIYMSPPIVDSADECEFWNGQAINRNDLLDLIAEGRLKFILAQPEERTDLSFLEAAYERNPDCVIGRRTSAALVISDIVQTADEYIFASPDARDAVINAARVISDEGGLRFEVIIRNLLWPLHARRSCFRPLMLNGLMGLDAFNQGIIFSDYIKDLTGRDLILEASFAGHGVHIAHALSATFIPPLTEMEGWIGPRQLMGEQLNFYRSFNTRFAAAWVGNEHRKERRERILPLLPLFDFDRNAPFSDIMQITSRSRVRRTGLALISRLMRLPLEDRNVEVDRLSRELYEIGARKSRMRAKIDFVSDVIDVGFAAADVAVAPIRPIWNLLGRVLDVARRSKKFDRLADVIDQDIKKTVGVDNDLDFLAKISRVAQLKET